MSAISRGTRRRTPLLQRVSRGVLALASLVAPSLEYPAGTNLLTQTDDFSHAAWSKVAATVSADAAAAPDGTVTADKVIPSTANTLHYFHQAAATAGATHTLTFIAKADGLSWFFVEVNTVQGGGAGIDTWFNASTGAVGTTGANITARSEDLGDGYYRFELTYAARATADTIYVVITNADGGGAFAGDGTSGILFWRARLVQV